MGRGRPRRPGGTVDASWPERINAFFERHPALTTRGVAHFLSDLAQGNGQGPVTYAMLSMYRSRSRARRPPERFQRLWEALEGLVAGMGDNLAILSQDGRHGLVPIRGKMLMLWIPPSAQWAIHECPSCHVSFVGQHNAVLCPSCQ